MLPSQTQTYYLGSTGGVVKYPPAKRKSSAWREVLALALSALFFAALIDVIIINWLTGCDRNNREACFLIDNLWGAEDAR